MELDAETLAGFDENINRHNLIAIRTANGNRIGLIPNTQFKADGFFVDGKFEIPHLICTALLPSGRIVSADESVQIPIPTLKSGEYYCCIGFGIDYTPFEYKNTTYERPQYIFSIKTIQELNNCDLFPIAKLRVEDGSCIIDKDYLPPCLLMSSDQRFSDHLTNIATLVKTIAYHDKLQEGDPRQSILKYHFRLKRFTLQNTVESFIALTEEISNAIDYFIFRNEEDLFPPTSPYDVNHWISYLTGHLTQAIQLLDASEINNKGIDFDELKSQIKSELYDQVIPELEEKISNQLREKINSDLETKLSETLKDYLDGTFQSQMHDTLQGELSSELQDKLYNTLYETLYQALYVPPTEEENSFIPLI